MLSLSRVFFRRVVAAALANCVLAAAFLGCDLSEVEIPQGDPMVVVQAVIRPDRDPQFVVVEQTFTGVVDYESTVDAIVPLEGEPRTPIENALVTLANLDAAADSCGSPVTLKEHSPAGSVSPGVYWAPGDWRRAPRRTAARSTSRRRSAR